MMNPAIGEPMVSPIITAPTVQANASVSAPSGAAIPIAPFAVAIVGAIDAPATNSTTPSSHVFDVTPSRPFPTAISARNSTIRRAGRVEAGARAIAMPPTMLPIDQIASSTPTSPSEPSARAWAVVAISIMPKLPPAPSVTSISVRTPGLRSAPKALASRACEGVHAREGCRVARTNVPPVVSAAATSRPAEGPNAAATPPTSTSGPPVNTISTATASSE